MAIITGFVEPKRDYAGFFFVLGGGGGVFFFFKRKFFRIKKQKHDFIVLEAKYFSGDFIAKAEIERVELFDFAQIRQMIQEKQILPDHAEALLKHIDEVTAFNVVYV